MRRAILSLTLLTIEILASNVTGFAGQTAGTSPQNPAAQSASQSVPFSAASTTNSKAASTQPTRSGASKPATPAPEKATPPKKKQAKPVAKPTPAKAPDQEQQIIAAGDLSKACPSGCPADLHVTVVNEKNESRQGTLVGTSNGISIINIAAPSDFHPTKVLVLGQIPARVAGVQNAAGASVLSVQTGSTLKDHRVAVRGDFRGAKSCTGYLSDAEQNPVNVDVVSITDRTAVIQYLAPNDFIPDTLTLQCATGGTIAVPFTVFRGVHRVITSFVSDSLDEVFCGKECKQVTEAEITLTLVPADPDAEVKLLRLTNGRVWIELTAPPDYAPQAITVYNSLNKETVYAKRMLGPLVDSHQPFVTYTIMDSETEKRDFGRRIAFNYFAINIQVHNPTTQKIQLNKARVWFDCDYALIKRGDLYKNDPKYLIVGGKPKKFFFGIDHTQRQFPHTLLQILSAFDAQTGKESAIFDGADLAASIFSALTGVFDTTEYAVATNVFSGILVPGLRKIIINPDVMNQKRATLMAQALDTVVQVSSKGATSTLLFVPRKGILAWQDTNGQDEQLPVIVDTIRDIHFEPEIVVDTAAAQNQSVTAGMTEDQVKAALGEPTTRNEQNDTLIYAYNSGPYKQVTFKKDGAGTYRVVSSDERSATEQLIEGKTTIADAERILGSSRVDLRNATDGGKIWVDPPVVGADLRFGQDNVLKSKSYHNAFGVLKPMIDQTLDVVVKKAEDLALTDAVKTEIEAKYPKEFANGVLRIPSPDFAGTTVVLSCKTDQKNNKCKVNTIE